MLYVLLYVLVMLLMFAHFTGWLAANNLEWIVMIAGALAFPAVLLL